jgi:hypothetical protein
MDARARVCEHCGQPVQETKRGRPQKFCSDRCRQAHRKLVTTPEYGLRYRRGRVRPKAAAQRAELTSKFEPENLSQKTNLRFERVNEVTFKLTDGEVTNVPASHGQWGGYRTTREVASVINVAPGQWLARCRNEVSGPSSFNEAKTNALAMARGAHGDYFIQNPIDHLNGLQARLEDRQNNEPPTAGTASNPKQKDLANEGSSKARKRWQVGDCEEAALR